MGFFFWLYNGFEMINDIDSIVMRFALNQQNTFSLGAAVYSLQFAAQIRRGTHIIVIRIYIYKYFISLVECSFWALLSGSIFDTFNCYVIHSWLVAKPKENECLSYILKAQYRMCPWLIVIFINHLIERIIEK